MVLSIYTGGVILFTGFTLLPVSPLNSSIIKHLLFTAEIRSTFLYPSPPEWMFIQTSHLVQVYLIHINMVLIINNN